MISQAQNNERLTTAITTLHYSIQSMSLHAAHLVGFKERGTSVIAVNSLVAIARNDRKVDKDEENIRTLSPALE